MRKDDVRRVITVFVLYKFIALNIICHSHALLLNPKIGNERRSLFSAMKSMKSQMHSNIRHEKKDVSLSKSDVLSKHSTVTNNSKIPPYNTEEEKNKQNKTPTNRRQILKRTFQTCTTVVLLPLTFQISPAKASSKKNRTDGYPVQKSEREWSYVLSGQQYNILRTGGTELPYSSILEEEERSGIYQCAACDNRLFDSREKFHSGTGWPSFADSIQESVEVENVNLIQKNLVGAELRCFKCGGHLGDVFKDGFLFVNTPAFKTGKRYCIDGAALVFKPNDGSESVYGDTPPPAESNDLPSFLQPPKINTRPVDY